MPHWTKIVLCDTRDKRGVTHSYDEIREFHRSYKDLKTGEALSEAEAQDRIARGEHGIARPWKEAGHHWAIARGASGEVEVVMLRPMTQNGAYAREQSFNRSAIGIVVEEFSDEFLDRLVVLCRFLVKTYKIRPDQIVGRWERNLSKQKPEGFSGDDVRQQVQLAMLEGILHNTPSSPEYAE